MPDLIGMFGHWNANILLARLDIIEEAKINRRGRFRKKRKVHAVAQPRRAKWIWKTEPSLYRSPKRAAFLSDMEHVGNYYGKAIPPKPLALALGRSRNRAIPGESDAPAIPPALTCDASWRPTPPNPRDLC